MLFRSLGRASRKPLRVQLLALRRNGRALTPVDVDTSSSSSPSTTSTAAGLVLLLAAAGSASSAFSTSSTRAEAAAVAVASASDERVRTQLEQQFPLPDYLRTADDFLFPPLQPFNAGKLQVSTTHSLYYEECGNPYGKVRSVQV